MTAAELLDCIYLAACDARLTRICIASIRYFYPNVPIKLLAGDIIQSGLADEVRKYWNVGLNLPVGDYGQMVKLEPLFGPAGQRFMVVDVDTVFTGNVLDLRARSPAPFFVDDEQLSDAVSSSSVTIGANCGTSTRRCSRPPRHSMSDSGSVPLGSSNVRSSILGSNGPCRAGCAIPICSWRRSRRLQLRRAAEGGFSQLRIDRATFMRWPGNGIADLGVDRVASGTAPPLVIHWAGMKAIFLRNMVGGDLLQFFENYYYTRLPAGRLRQILALWRHVWINVSFAVGRRVRLRWRR